ncbi:hypothetical protein MMC22_004389 [Lobaria immixta]|nr:hypothetical protein [Lobaria immixta]
MAGATNLGDGRHIQELSHHTTVLLLKDLLATQFAWCVSVGLVKLGILLFYLRIFAVRQHRVATFIMMGVAMCWMLAAILGAFFQCRPLSYAWNKLQEGNCDERVRFWVAIGISHIVTDVLILLLPVHMVWKLQVPSATKIGLFALFGLGSLICIISGFRLRSLDATNNSDVSYYVPIPHIWSMLEPTVAICTSCLPMTRPVFLRFMSSSPASKPPAGHSMKPKAADSYSSAEEAIAGQFRRLSEQDIPLKAITRIHATGGKESEDDPEPPPLKRATERELEGITVRREWDVRY